VHHRGQPPLVPRPRSSSGSCCAAPSTSCQEGAVRQPPAGVVPQTASRLPHRSRQRPTPTRCPPPARSSSAATPSSSSPRARAFRPGTLGTPKRASGDWRWRPARPVVPIAVFGTEGHPPRLAHPPAQGPPARRPTAHVPARGEPEPAPGARRHRAHLAVHRPAVGVARRHAARAPRRPSSAPARGAPALAVALARAGLEVDLACRTEDQTAAARRGAHQRALPAGHRAAPRRSRPVRGRPRRDEPRPRRPRRPRPGAAAGRRRHGARHPRRAGVLVVAKGLVPGGGVTGGFAAVDMRELRSARCPPPTSPSARRRARWPSSRPGHAHDALTHGASLVVAAADQGFARQVAELLRRAGLEATRSTDVTASSSRLRQNAAAFAAAAASHHGPTPPAPPPARCSPRSPRSPARRGAIQHVRRPGRHRATSWRPCWPASRATPRRRQLSAAGCPPTRSRPAPGPRRPRRSTRCPSSPGCCADADMDAPATTSLADVVEGRIPPDRWVAGLRAA